MQVQLKTSFSVHSMCWSTVFALKTLSYQSNEGVGIWKRRRDEPKCSSLSVLMSLIVTARKTRRNKPLVWIQGVFFHWITFKWNPQLSCERLQHCTEKEAWGAHLHPETPWNSIRFKRKWWRALNINKYTSHTWRLEPKKGHLNERK